MYLDISILGGHVEEWHIHRCNRKHIVCYQLHPQKHMTEWSTSDSLGDISWVQKAASQLYSYRTNVHSSTHPLNVQYVIACDQFYHAFSLQVTNAGVRRPGYEDNPIP